MALASAGDDDVLTVRARDSVHGVQDQLVRDPLLVELRVSRSRGGG